MRTCPYSSELSVRDTEKAIKYIKDNFERILAINLHLERVSAPILVTSASGLNDDLSGVERKVRFSCAKIDEDVEIVQSLAKWKRMALLEYGFDAGEGLYTDMNAIRRDDSVDNIHSIFVDQWDWEKVITRKERTVEYLKETVQRIVESVFETQAALYAQFPELEKNYISREVCFITTQELEDLYPDLTPKERENKIAEKYKTVFLMQIGSKLKSGEKHDGRAPDYDDWDLNGDIFFWHETLNCALEISSMGIRVDPKSLDSQLKAAGADERRKLLFHKELLEGKLPLTMGGGIGQSRLSMLMLQKAHVGEVQVSLWDESTKRIAQENGIHLL